MNVPHLMTWRPQPPLRPRRRDLGQAACRLFTYVWLLCALTASASASELSDDLRIRRAGVMTRLGAETMTILWSAPTQRYSLDIDYEYRQDSNLYYLTALAQEGSVLVLMPGNVSRREILFVKDKDPAQEHWHGRILSVDEVRDRTGIQTVLSTGEFEPFVAAILSGRGSGEVTAQEAARFFAALSTGRAHLALALDAGRSLAGPPSPPLQFAQRNELGAFDVADVPFHRLTDVQEGEFLPVQHHFVHLLGRYFVFAAFVFSSQQQPYILSSVSPDPIFCNHSRENHRSAAF